MGLFTFSVSFPTQSWLLLEVQGNMLQFLVDINHFGRGRRTHFSPPKLRIPRQAELCFGMAQWVPQQWKHVLKHSTRPVVVSSNTYRLSQVFPSVSKSLWVVLVVFSAVALACDCFGNRPILQILELS